MHWNVVANNFDYLLVGAFPKGPLGGLAMTAILAVGGIFGAFWLGLGIGLMRIAKNRKLRWPAMARRHGPALNRHPCRPALCPLRGALPDCSLPTSMTVP